MNIKTILHNELSKPDHVVKVHDKANGLRLRKDSKHRKFVFSMDDINDYFGGFDGLFNDLQNKGFKNIEFVFQRIYGTPENTTYHDMKKETVNISELFSDTPAVYNNQNNLGTQQQQMQQPFQQPNFLAGTVGGGLNNMAMLGAFVDAERSKDYRKRADDLEEIVKDLRSELRSLKEENASLKLKEATVQERADLRVQQQLLDKKSFFETEGFQRVAEGLGAVLPEVLPALMNRGVQATTQLGQPANQNLTPLQNKIIDFVKNANDEQLSLVAVVLQNQEIKQLITDYLENGN